MTSIYDKLYEMDGFIAGFPIYTARENGIMAKFMDRWDCLSNPYLTRKMPGMKKGLIVTCRRNIIYSKLHLFF